LLLARAAPDWEDIASDVQLALEGFEVDDFWRRCGASSQGYRDPAVVAYQVLEELLEEFLIEMDRFAQFGMTAASLASIKGILTGLHGFEFDCKTAFREQLHDEIMEVAGQALERWLRQQPSVSDQNKLGDFMPQECPDYTKIRPQMVCASNMPGKSCAGSPQPQRGCRT
jgi:hypothetical protein